MENQNLDCWNEEFSRKIVGNELGTISISPRTRHRHFLEPSVEIYAPNRCRFVRYITFLQQPCSLDSKRNSLLSHLCDHLRDIIRTFTKRAACKSRRKVSNWSVTRTWNGKFFIEREISIAKWTFTWRELNMNYCNVRANELVVFPLELHENACPNGYHTGWKSFNVSFDRFLAITVDSKFSCRKIKFWNKNVS